MEKYSSEPASNKWDKHKSKQFKPAKEPPLGVIPSKDIVSAGYEDYLVLLQERNRLLKKLKEKDSKQIELEKKEQGFSLYVNGANAELSNVQPPSTSKGRAPSRQTKTADVYSQRRRQLEFELQWLEREVGEVRAKTAPIPDQLPRKEWQPDFIQIKTNKGSKLKVKAPGALSGYYSEDFEAMEVGGDDVMDSFLNSSEEIAFEDNSDDEEDELTLSINDVETLRKSLEADHSIQESIKAAQERIRLEEETGKEPDDNDVEDEIEEELEGASNSLNLAELDRLPQLTPTSKSIEIKQKPTRNVNKQSISFEIPMHDQPVEKDVTPILKEKTFVKESFMKESTPKEKPSTSDEDLVVLSFSTNSKNKKERVLSSTRRKEDADNILASSTPRKGQNAKQPEPTPLQSKDNQVELKSSQKTRTRALSSTSTRNKSNKQTTEDNNADEIFKAMALENQNIEVSSGSRTAPENRTVDSTEAEGEPQRPASIASTKENTISRVTQKVRSMDPRQQQHLISLLSKLELKAPPFKASGPMTTTGRGSPMKATVDYSSAQQSLNSNSSVATSVISSQGVHSVDSSYVGLQYDGIVDVNIEIQSNWGHPNTLGITEVQFFSDDGNPVKYTANDFSVSGYFGDQGMVANIANTKTKTNKPRYMWCCQFIPGSPVEIMFHLPVNQQSISKIVIWNFNGGVRDLNMGIKDVRIFVGGILMWKGAIEKGCGNQVFDYSTIINLNEPNNSLSPKLSVQPPVRSETVVLKKSCDETQQSIGEMPVVDKKTVEHDLKLSRSKDLSIPSSSSKQKATSSSPTPGSSFMSRTPENKGHASLAGSLSKKLVNQAEGRLVTRSSSTPNLSSNTGTNVNISEDALRGDSAALPNKPPWLENNKKPRSRSSSRSKSRPIWLTEDDASKCAKNDYERSKSPKRSSSSTERRARASPDPVPGTTRCRSTGARSYSLPGTSGKQDKWPENFASRKEGDLPTCLDSTTAATKKRPDSRHSRQKVPSPIPSSQPPEHVEQPRPLGDQQHNQSSISKRQQWRMEQSLSLEESWNVLSMFEKSHKGRITKDMSLECQDDALDKFLSSEVNRPELRNEQQTDQTDFRPMDEGVVHRSQEIPTLPKGKQLVINILSTWGDKHYVGLNGIEIFTEYGKPAKIQEITADPLDINILPDYGSDPRVVTNLVDGIFRTRDDMHLWMAPFTQRENHHILITFTEPIKIAMIRIWNYNKSRIHSYRGARDIDITLDDNLIFEGEIQRATGTLGQDEPFGDTILFTMDEEILDAMSLYDQTYEIPDEEDSLMYSQEYERPSTPNRGDDEDNDDRPFTRARQRRTTDEEDEEITDDVEQTSEDSIPYGQVLELCFVATWGDPYYMGLTGLELFGPNMETVPVAFNMMEANPRDLNDLPNYDEDDRTLDKIIDGMNVTTSDEHMWLIPFNEGEDHTLTIDLRHRTQLMGMRVWNYNKSHDDTFRGAKLVHVKLDGRVLSPSDGILLRKGPGNMYFDFAQDVYFVKSAAPSLRHVATASADSEPNRRPESRVNIKKLIPDYEPTLMPTGFVFQFQLLSSWGDPYYIGLNGIQFYDENGYRIHLTESNMTAHPHSVNVLDGVTDDIRTPDKLIDGVNDTNDGRHMWLAPIIPGQKNLIFVVFDEPVTVSMVKIWNYSKTPIRGVQQFVLMVDDLLVYHGILPQVTTGSAILPGLDLPVPHHTVLFTDREKIAMAERKNVVHSIDMEQDVQLTNDKRIVTRYADPKSVGKAVDPALRPKTSVKSLASKHTR